MPGRSSTLKPSGPLDYLLSFADWERGVGWNSHSAPDEAWKLGRTRALLDLAGAPDRAHSHRITIAGTNGKGSTGAILESILRAAGLRTGVYSQPHLHDFRERIRIDGASIGEEPFARGVELLRHYVDQLAQQHPEAGEPTTFELTTALAAIAFRDAGVDAAILEVGLGGRLDAVNAIDPTLVLVTSIGYDHVQILGGTLGSIAREKAGVFRPGVLALTALQRPTAARALAAAARATRSPLRTIPPLPSAGQLDPGRGQLVCLPPTVSPMPAERPPLNWLGLLGTHQRQNAALALAAADEILGRVRLTAAAPAGLANARWPGRLEWLPTDPSVVLDGAHNPPGAEALAAALDEIAPEARTALVFGCARDKRARGLLRPLLRRATRVWTVAADDPRAADPTRLAALARSLGAPAEVAPSVAAAVEAAHASGADLVLVAGSLRVVADARRALALT